MPETRLGSARLGAVLGLGLLTLTVGLGSSGRLSYHEAFVAQAAREMIASGDLLTPTLGGLPWMEKPPLAIWLVALLGRVVGSVTEDVARAPSVVAALGLVLTVAILAARRFGPAVGLLSGLIQATTAWTVTRGRLAEADILLAAFVAMTLAAFDRLRGDLEHQSGVKADNWRWVFFAGLGLTSLTKGVGFGAALVLSAVGLTMLWDRDRLALKRLCFARGWMLAAVLGLTWPLLEALRHPSALGLWTLHVTDRFSARPTHFAGQPTWEYALTILMMLLPWTPLAISGAFKSLPGALGREAKPGRFGGDRLFLAWLIGPLALLSLATVKNSHYAIHALPPCSIWAAQGLLRLGGRFQNARGWSPSTIRRAAFAGFGALGMAYAMGFLLLGPKLDRRGEEWAFYRDAALKLQPGERVELLYHVPEWDRLPYDTPFGPVPHDFAVRLFYLGRPASCRFDLAELAEGESMSTLKSFAVIGRESDEPSLNKLGHVETLALGPPVRSDRTYRLYRVTPTTIAVRAAEIKRR